MIPARSVFAKTTAARAASRARLVCIEQVHGAAGCSEYGLAQNLWSPAATGRSFDISKGTLSPLEPFRDHLTIVSNTDARMAEAQSAPEVGGDHFRSSAVMYTHAHPKLTEGSDVKVGTSMDQFYVQKFGKDTPIPSMQLSIEPVDQSGGCAYGYACVYTDTISWAAARPAAADGARSAHGLRAAVRRRRHAGAARAAPRDGSQHPGPAARVRWPAFGGRSDRPIGSAWISTPATSATSSSASRGSRRAIRAARRASCPGRQQAFRMRSTSTSS